MSSNLEATFAENWVTLYPEIDLHSEYYFAKPRKFRWDFAHLESRIAIELQGGTYSKGRHTNGAALAREYEKLNIAAQKGWRVFFLDTNMVNDLGIYEAIASTIINTNAGLL